MDEPKGREAEQEPGQADAPERAPEEAALLRRRSFIRRSAEVATMSLFGLGGVDGVIQRVLGRVAEQTQMHGLADAIANRLAGSGVMTPRAHAAPSTADCPSGYGGVNPLDQCQPGPVACEPAPFGCVPPVACEPEPFACVPPHACPEPYGCPEPFGVCPPGSLNNCPENQVPAFACHAATMPPFAGCLWPDFKCEWGEQFHCQVDDTHFDCDKVGQPPGHVGFSCPPWIDGTAWFDCRQSGEAGPGEPFNCNWPTQLFDCGGSGNGYLCPGVNEFHAGCIGEGWACEDQFAICGGEGAFVCPGEGGFHCRDLVPVAFMCKPEGTPPLVGFACGRPERPFTCDASTVYDFDCGDKGVVEPSGFTCGALVGGQPSGEFDCTSNHVFRCVHNEFSCMGSVFRCSAGGARCGIGQTGGFTSDQVGDFDCRGVQGVGVEFWCEGVFTCEAADDFACGFGNQVFTCRGRFSGCHPGPGGHFECQLGPGCFVCEEQGGEEFQCAQEEHECATDGRRFSSADV